MSLFHYDYFFHCELAIAAVAIVSMVMATASALQQVFLVHFARRRKKLNTIDDGVHIHIFYGEKEN